MVLHRTHKNLPSLRHRKRPNPRKLASRFIALERLFQALPAVSNLTAPYKAHHVEPPNLANGPRIESLIKDGKPCFSWTMPLRSPWKIILDLAIARYNSSIADTDVLRTERVLPLSE